MDTTELFQDDDLDAEVKGSVTAGSGGADGGKQQASDLLQSMEGLSARERNRLKRKAKAMGRQESMVGRDGSMSQVNK